MITADQGLRGGKIIGLKKTVDAAVQKCPSVKRVFVYQRTGADVPMGKLDIPLEKVRLNSLYATWFCKNISNLRLLA